MSEARSSLVVRRVDGRSVVVGALVASPLRLLNPRSPGDAAWVFQSSLGGGFVGRDELSLHVDVEAGATLFLSSQASSKVYRGATARFDLDATVAEGGALVCWPDPVACFAGASFEQRQRVHLAPGANLVLVDAVSAGCPAHGETWDARRLALATEVDVAGAPCFRDALLLCGAHGALRERLSGTGAVATAALLGPRFDGVAGALAARVAAAGNAGGELVVCSPHPRGAVLRLLAGAAEALQGRLRALLSPLVTPLLGDDPFARKW